MGEIPYAIANPNKLFDLEDLPEEVKTVTYSNVYPSRFNYLSYSNPNEIINYFTDYNIFLKVPIGELTLTSSREDLVVNDKLREYINKKFNKVLIDAYNSLTEKIKSTEELVDKLDLAFNNFPILSNIEIEGKKYKLGSSNLDVSTAFETSLYYYYDLESITSVHLVYNESELKTTQKDMGDLIYSSDATDSSTVEIREFKESLKYVDLNDYTSTIKLSSLLRCDLLLVKSSYKFENVLKAYEFNKDKFTLVVRVKDEESFKKSLLTIKEVSVYKSLKNTNSLKSERTIDISKLRKQDVAYTVAKNKSYYSNSQFQELFYQEVFSLPKEGVYITRDRVNDYISGRISNSLAFLKYIKYSEDIYMVNQRVGSVLNVNPNWKSLGTYINERIKSYFPEDKLLRDAICQTLNLPSREKESWRFLLEGCIEYGYTIDKNYIDFINSIEYANLVQADKRNLFCEDDIDKEPIEAKKIYEFDGPDSLNLRKLFCYTFKDDLGYFNIYLPLILSGYYVKDLIKESVKHTVELLKIKRRSSN